MVLIAGVDGSLLTPFRLWFSSVVFDPTVKTACKYKHQIPSSLFRLVLFLVDLGSFFFFTVNNGKQFESPC